MRIKIGKKVITERSIKKCLDILESKVESAEIVLQAIGYTLLDTDLFPEENLYAEECSPIIVTLEYSTRGDVHRAEAVLLDNMGEVNEFEVKTIIQKIGQELIGTELYPIR